MADIAKFGIEVDPKGAVTGSAKAEKALKDLGDQAGKTQNDLDQSFKTSGQSAASMARMSKGAFGDMVNGMIDLLDGIGLLNNGFGALVRRGQSFTQAGSRLSGTFAGMASAGAAAGAGGTAAATGTAAAGAAAGGAAIGFGTLMAVLLPIIAIVAAVVIAWKTLSAVFQGMKLGVGIAAQFETVTVAMETMIGSTSRTAKLLGEIEQYASFTPMSSTDLTNTTKVLLNFGIGVEDVMGTLKMLGDVSGGSVEKLNSLAIAYGQVASNGKLMGQDLLQFINAGFNPLLVISQQTGKSMGQLRQEMSDGQITFKMVEQAFVTATSAGGQFNGMLDRIAKTYEGKVSTLGDVWTVLLRTMATPVKDALKPVIDDLITFVTWATPYAAAFGQMVGSAISTLHQAITDKRLGELLGLTFMAGVESIGQGLINVIASTLDFLKNSWTYVVDYFGTKLGDALGSAFTTAVNLFQAALFPVLSMVDNTILSAKIMSNSALKTNFNENVPLRRAPVPGVYVPDKRETLQDFWQSNQKSTFTDMFGSNSRQAKDTSYNDRAALLASELQLKHRERFTMSPIEGPPRPTMTSDLATDASGKDKKTKEPKEQVNDQFKQTLEDMANLQQQMDNFTATTLTNFGDGFTGAFTSIALGTKTVAAAFTEMAGAIVSRIIEMIIQMTVWHALQKTMGAGMMGGGGSMGGGIMGFIGGLAKMHSGGSAGAPGIGRAGVSGFGRYDSGGITSSEAAIKVDRNETILTRRRAEEIEAQLSDRRGGRKNESQGQKVQILNVTDPSQVADAIAANPDMILNAISRRAPAIRQMIIQGK